jgi:hypothetical protein
MSGARIHCGPRDWKTSSQVVRTWKAVCMVADEVINAALKDDLYLRLLPRTQRMESVAYQRRRSRP